MLDSQMFRKKKEMLKLLNPFLEQIFTLTLWRLNK